MTGSDGGIVFVCTGRHTHPVTAAARNEPTAVMPAAAVPLGLSPAVSRHPLVPVIARMF
jgi:hypothetical protein